MRSVDRQAGVDPALVAHFFGTKHKLFVDVVELPFDPDQVVSALFAGEAGRSAGASPTSCSPRSRTPRRAGA